MKAVILGLALTATALSVAAEQCVMQQRTVTQHAAKIDERSAIRREVVPQPDGGKKCVVNMRVRIANQWHTAFGEYAWDGHRPSHDACGIAVKRAEDAVIARLGRGASTTEHTLICQDRPELAELKSTSVGQVGRASEFRFHPEYPMRFWHNGAQCRWFLESNFTGQDIRQFQGIICELARDQWVVVDKF